MMLNHFMVVQDDVDVLNTDNFWQGGRDTLLDIKRACKEEEFVDLLEEMFCDKTPTMTELNDFLWFDRDYIYEQLGLDENGNLADDDEEEEDSEEDN